MGIIDILFSEIFFIALEIESIAVFVFPTSIKLAFLKGKNFKKFLFNFDMAI